MDTYVHRYTYTYFSSSTFLMRFMMNERARTCASIEYDDDLCMSFSVLTIASLMFVHALRASTSVSWAVVLVMIMMMMIV